MIWFDYRALGSGRKLRGTAEHLIDTREKRICQLSSACYWKAQLFCDEHPHAFSSTRVPLPSSLCRAHILVA